MGRWPARLALLLAVAVLAAGTAVGWIFHDVGQPGPAMTPVTVVIAKGTGSRAIGADLQAAGVVSNGTLFAVAVHLTGGGALKAGEYAFPAHASLAAIIDMMRRGLVVIHKITLPEGLTVAQFLTVLDDAAGLTGTTPVPAEGSLLPETYQYLLGESRGEVIARMQRAMTATLDELWGNRAAGLPFADERQAVILASIVERETAQPDERPRVAAVYENRLRQGMKLEADPTVIYAASDGSGVLGHPITRDELAEANPYNTYVEPGLPPGPICNPGRASLDAVLHPAASDDLYFVADGSGHHVFAKSLVEHERQVAQWREFEKTHSTAPNAGPAPDPTR